MISAEQIQNEADESSSGILSGDWELDFYSRPILEPDGKKRWELLIVSSPIEQTSSTFQFEKRCPAGSVNSTWLTEALKEAISAAESQGWSSPRKLRSWRSSMRTMIQRACSELGLEMVPSRRTYALFDWIAERELDLYPKEEGYMAGPLAPPPARVSSPPRPLPESLRGDTWNWAELSASSLREASAWPIGFRGLLPVPETINDDQIIPGLRLFSQTRGLALAGLLGGMEPVCLKVSSNQLLLEAGQDDCWLVSDLSAEEANTVSSLMKQASDHADGLQFIAVQTSPEAERFEGFWLLRDQAER
ncbi:MAG: hypothetical protein CMK50_03065 [Propionibacteriaceae bacterium]|jgi:hypothetical protein|nr:hypothetical protein [Propionibacteriaceae bacterium]MBT66792.1 hypothetical protein [Synechococcus sp. NP17]|tara:strand:- start:127 stop:1041 length:915 start_codon:yes stop_codon:yes gene_type:complete